MTTGGVAPRPIGSIIVPAHDEATLIASCLGRILDGSEPGEWEVIVVCNGCTDDTAARARAFAGVTVLETETAGKMPALDLGDETATVFPRLYVDADAIVDAVALRGLVEALRDGGAMAGSPRLHVDATASSRLVQVYFSVWSRLRYAQEAIGSGVYGLSEEARGRFGRFPERGGDDQLVYRLYTPEERVVTDPSFTYVAPRTIRSLVRGRARMNALNIELERTVELPQDAGIGWREQGIDTVARSRPHMMPRVAWFMAVQIVVKLWSRRMAQADEIPWNQDRTSRVEAPTG